MSNRPQITRLPFLASAHFTSRPTGSHAIFTHTIFTSFCAQYIDLIRNFQIYFFRVIYYDPPGTVYRPAATCSLPVRLISRQCVPYRRDNRRRRAPY
jgi:hypothetical protein